MPPAVKIPLPKGAIGVSFRGTPPIVSKVADESPLLGKVQEGYSVHSLILPNGDVLSAANLSTSTLVAALKKNGNEKGRKLKFTMAMPEELNIQLPAVESSSSGLGFTIRGHPPAVTEIRDDRLKTKKDPSSPTLRIGMVVDRVVLWDGTNLLGHGAEEIMSALTDDLASATPSSSWTLHLVKPGRELPSKRVVLPDSKTILLPPVPTLGITFEESLDIRTRATTVSLIRLSDDSPLRGLARVGMVVDTLTVSGGAVSHRGLSAMDLGQALAATASEQGRTILLKSPQNKFLPKLSTTQLSLPSGAVSDWGIKFSDNAKQISVVVDVKDDSPLAPTMRPGQVILSVGLPNGIEYDDLPTDELYAVLHDSANAADQTRFWIVENRPAPLVDETTVTLPAGKLGVNFVGAPPRINKILPGSPLAGKVFIGQVVDTLVLPQTDEILYQLSAKELVGVLVETNEHTDRVARFINPDTRTLTAPPILPLPDYRALPLPASYPLGIGMTDVNGLVTITSVRKSSPLLKPGAGGEATLLGMAIDTVSFPNGQVLMQRTAAQFNDALKSTSDQEGRILLLKNPNSDTIAFSTLPDRLNIALPAGKLGITFGKTAPPMVERFTEDSPMSSIVPVGMFADMLTLSNGTILSGMTTYELVAELNASSAEIERHLLLKNPRNQNPTPAEVVLPDKAMVVLPTGTLGVSFRQTASGCVVSRVHEESQVYHLIRPGMAVDILTVKTGQVFTGLTAKECCRLLRASKETSGRKMILKNPETASMSQRNVVVSESGDLTSVNGDKVYDDESHRG
jgi:hypothetical protein